MQLTDKEEKLARLALDKAAHDGERANAAARLIQSLHKRGVTVEDIQKETVRTKVVYREAPVTPTPEEYAPPPPPPPDPNSEWRERVRRKREQQAEAEAAQEEMKRRQQAESEWKEHMRRKEAAQEEEKRRQAAARSTVEPPPSVAPEQIEKYGVYVVGFLILAGIAIILIGVLISVITWLCQFPVSVFLLFAGLLFLIHYLYSLRN